MSFRIPFHKQSGHSNASSTGLQKKVDNGKFVIHGTDDSEADKENWKLVRKNIVFLSLT